MTVAEIVIPAGTKPGSIIRVDVAGQLVSVKVPASEAQADGADDVLFSFGVIADVQYADRFSAFAPARDRARRADLCVSRALTSQITRERERARAGARLGQNIHRTVTQRYRNYC